MCSQMSHFKQLMTLPAEMFCQTQHMHDVRCDEQQGIYVLTSSKRDRSEIEGCELLCQLFTHIETLNEES